MDINIQQKKFIIYSIVHSQFRLISAFVFIFSEGLVTFVYVLPKFSQFVSFAIFKTVSKVKENDLLVRSSANLKSFLNGRFTSFIYLRNFFFSHAQKLHFRLTDTFFHCLSPFSEFSFQSNPNNKDPFLILGNTRFHYRLYIWIVTSLKSTTRYHKYKSYSKLFISASVIQKLQKSVVSRKIYFTLSPFNKTFTYSDRNTKHS